MNAAFLPEPGARESFILFEGAVPGCCQRWLRFALNGREGWQRFSGGGRHRRGRAVVVVAGDRAGCCCCGSLTGKFIIVQKVHTAESCRWSSAAIT